MDGGLLGAPVAGAGNGAPAAAHPPGVFASAATGIVGFIQQFGGDVDRIFGSVRILPDMAGSPTLKLKLRSFCALFEEAARHTRHDNFGLWFGNQFKPRDLGLWGYAAVSAPTLGSALENLVGLFRYHQESSVMRLTGGDDGLVRLEYRINAASIIERRQDAELSLGMFLNVLRECCGPAWAPEEVHFEHPRPGSAKEHELAFDAPVYFSQPTNALLFNPEILDRRMPSSDLKLLTVMQTCLEQLSGDVAAEDVLADRLRSAIRMKLPDGYPTLEQIAAELRVAASAICRDLHECGLTYTELVEGVRRDLALSYVRQRQLPFSDIAMLLGYSELSAFSRAFRRWMGVSPREYRVHTLSA